VDDEGFYLQNEGQGRVNFRRRVRARESPPGWDGGAEMPLKEWEPLKALKDGLKDLDKRAAYGKSASEFFDNIKPAEFVENLKRSLVRSFNSCTLCFFSVKLWLACVIYVERCLTALAYFKYWYFVSRKCPFHIITVQISVILIVL